MPIVPTTTEDKRPDLNVFFAVVFFVQFEMGIYYHGM